MKKIDKAKAKKWFKEEGFWTVGAIASSIMWYKLGYRDGRKKGYREAWYEIIKHVTRTGEAACRLSWKDGRNLTIHMYAD